MTTQDLLNITLAGVSILTAIFLCTVLLYIILILHDVYKITKYAKHTAKKINESLLKPVKLIYAFSDKLKPILDIIEEKLKQKVEELRKRRKS
ncbi:hypothetical protein HYV56_00630 [Candidatus Peregrinibacteria bacterium]|nr:hypothetical protein [Candidatus Peregrinibacteria bacterium]